MAVSYPADGNATYFRIEDDSFWFRHRNRCICEAVRQFPPAGAILDIGGGNGFVARGLIDAGYRTVLLEPGSEGAGNARLHRGIPEVINATLDDAGLDAGSIAAAGAFDVLEHVEDDRAFLARVHALLQPGGLVYVTVPAFPALWSITDVQAGHFRRYTMAPLTELFSTAGFDVRFATYFFEAMVLPLLVKRTLPFRLGMSRTAAASQRDVSRRGLLTAILGRLLEREVDAISRRRTLMTGTSCLLVAQKRREVRRRTT